MKNKRVIYSILFFMVILSMAWVIGCGGGDGGTVVNPGITPYPTTPVPNPTTPIPVGQIPATVEVPTGIAPASLEIISRNNPIIKPSANGDFSITIQNDKTQVVSAMFPDNDFGYIAVITGNSVNASQNSKLTLNATTTAESLLFLSPLLYQNDPVKAKQILELIRSDSNFSNLVSTINKISTYSDPLESQEFQNSYDKALASILNRAKSSNVSAFSSNTSEKNTEDTNKLIKLDKNPLSVNLHKEWLSYTSLDITTTNNDKYKIEVKEGQQKAPIEWITNLAEINASNFPQGTGVFQKDEIFTRTKGGTSYMANFHGDHTDFFKYLEWLDIIGTIVDRVVNWISSWTLDTIASDGCLYIPSDRDGIYIVRIYNGMNYSVSDQDLYFVASLPEGVQISQRAFDVNCGMIAFDILNLVIDGKILQDVFGKDTMNQIMANLFIDGLKESANIRPIELDTTNHSQEASAKWVIQITNIFSKQLVTKLTEEALKPVVKPGMKSLLKWIKTTYKVTIRTSTVALNAIGEIPKVGNLFERLAWAFGMQTNLESALIVVGSPTTPTPTEDYFPLSTGWKWNFKQTVQDPNGNSTYTYEVSNSTGTFLDNSVFVKKFQGSNKDTWSEEYFQKTTDVIMLGWKSTSKTFKYNPFVTLLKYPLSLNSSWPIDFNQIEVTTGATDTCKSNTTIVAKENVNVPAGNFASCYKVKYDYLYTWSNHTQESIIEYWWYAPNVGVVKGTRSRNNYSFEIVLTGYTKPSGQKVGDTDFKVDEGSVKEGYEPEFPGNIMIKNR